MPLTTTIPNVERLLGIPLSQLDEPGLVRLVELGTTEGATLDFKREFPTHITSGAELAKDICAMANSQGGLLIYGIEEQSGAASQLTPFSQPKGELRDRIAQVLHSHSRPPPSFDVEMVPSEKQDQAYILLAVPRSPHAPHAILRTDRHDTWLQFPVRYESTTRYMDEAELASRYHQRHLTGQDRLARLRLLASRAETRDSHVTVSLASVPINPGDMSISEKTGRFWRTRLADVLLSGNDSFGLPVDQECTDIRFLPGGIRINMTSGHVDLYRDGSVSSVLHLDPFVLPVLGRLASRPAGLLDHTAACMLAAFLSFAASFSQEECGTMGEVLVAVTTNARAQDGSSRNIALVSGRSSETHDHRRTIGNTCARIDLETSITAEALTRSHRARIATLHSLLSDLVNYFGLPAPGMTTSEGQLIVARFPMELRDKVSAWALANQVETP